MSVWRNTLPYDIMLIIAHLAFLTALPKNKQSEILRQAGLLERTSYHLLYGMTIAACNTAVFVLFGAVGLKISAAICLLAMITLLIPIWWNSERSSNRE